MIDEQAQSWKHGVHFVDGDVVFQKPQTDFWKGLEGVLQKGWLMKNRPLGRFCCAPRTFLCDARSNKVSSY